MCGNCELQKVVIERLEETIEQLEERLEYYQRLLFDRKDTN